MINLEKLQSLIFENKIRSRDMGQKGVEMTFLGIFSETPLRILFVFTEKEDLIVIHTCTKFHVQEKSGSRDMGSKGVKNGGFRDFLRKFNFYSVHSPRQ